MKKKGLISKLGGVAVTISLIGGCSSPPTNNHELAREYQTPAQTQDVSVLSPQTSPVPQPRPNTTQICGIPYYQLRNTIPREFFVIDIIRDIDIRQLDQYQTLGNSRINTTLTQLIAQNTPKGIYIGYVLGEPVSSTGIVSTAFIPDKEFLIIPNTLYTRNFNPNKDNSEAFIENNQTIQIIAPLTNHPEIARNFPLCQAINDLTFHINNIKNEKRPSPVISFERLTNSQGT